MIIILIKKIIRRFQYACLHEDRQIFWEYKLLKSKKLYQESLLNLSQPVHILSIHFGNSKHFYII